MALVSISEAAKLAGIARSQLYSQYINQGLISLSRDERGRPRIDTSELLRVFGAISLESDRTDRTDRTPETVLTRTGQDNQNQQALINLLTEQLAEAKERERFYQHQLAELTQTIKLLEHKPEPKGHHWWKFWH